MIILKCSKCNDKIERSIYIKSPVCFNCKEKRRFEYRLKKAEQKAKKNVCSDCATQLLVKNTYKCNVCKTLCCGSHIYQYVDEANKSITKNSPELCKECYKIKYGK